MCDKEQLTYNKGMKILIRGFYIVIEVERNRVIYSGYLDNKKFRSPVISKDYYFASQLADPYDVDYVPTQNDEQIIKEVLAIKRILPPPVRYEKYHLFTEEEYGRLDVETKKRVLFMEIADGTVVYMPWYINQDNSI